MGRTADVATWLPERRHQRPVYAVAVALVLSLLFYANVPIYGALFLWPVQPLHLLLVFGAALFPLLIGREGLRLRVECPFVLWCLVYLSVCALWYALFGGGSDEPLRARVLAVAFLLSAYALFVHREEVVRWVRYTLLVCVVFGVLVNVYDISHPFALVPATSEFAILGRASGLYVNPNQSGLALLMGFVLTIDLCRRPLRPLYTVIVLVGVVLTVSRGAILGAGLVLVLLIRSGSLQLRQAFGIVVVCGSLGVLLAGAMIATTDSLPLDFTLLSDRIAWFLDFGSTADYSQRVRISVAEKAWGLFAEHPFLGAGLGATELWDERFSTHNMYLTGLADFGLLGALIFPALVCASAGGLARMFQRDRAAFSALALWGGMFSHNLIGEYYFMIGLCVMAAIAEHETRPAPIRGGTTPVGT